MWKKIQFEKDRICYVENTHSLEDKWIHACPCITRLSWHLVRNCMAEQLLYCSSVLFHRWCCASAIRGKMDDGKGGRAYSTPTVLPKTEETFTINRKMIGMGV